jgi:guanylate kinase
MRRGFPIIISGPTGSGKTSLSNKIVKLDRGVKYSVSATTRPKRKGEREGRDYHFVEHKTFEEWIRSEKFCEWAKVHDHYYGTLRNFIEQTLSKGKEVVIDVDYQGRKALRKEYPDGVYIFLLPPTYADLEKRLRKRGTESKEAIRKRLEGVEKELKGLKSADYLVINRNILKTAHAVQMIIKAERLRGMRQNLQGWRKPGVRKPKSSR